MDRTPRLLIEWALPELSGIRADALRTADRAQGEAATEVGQAKTASIRGIA